MLTLQDGDRVLDLRARTAGPDRSVSGGPTRPRCWPAYDEYQAGTERDIPVVYPRTRLIGGVGSVVVLGGAEAWAAWPS